MTGQVSARPASGPRHHPSLAGRQADHARPPLRARAQKFSAKFTMARWLAGVVTGASVKVRS